MNRLREQRMIGRMPVSAIGLFPMLVHYESVEPRAASPI